MDQNKIEAYLRAFSRLVDQQPGTANFDIEQATVDAIWEKLSLKEKSEAYDRASLYRERLAQK